MVLAGQSTRNLKDVSLLCSKYSTGAFSVMWTEEEPFLSWVQDPIQLLHSIAITGELICFHVRGRQGPWGTVPEASSEVVLELSR